jgi:site-specific recombinase XerD
MSQTIGYARVSPADQPTTAEVLLALERHLERGPLSEETVTAYKRQADSFLKWWDPLEYPDAFADQVGAEAAVMAWRRYLLAEAKLSPASVNQALAAVSLLYTVGRRIRIKVKRARVGKPGAPSALERREEGALRRAAERRGPRDAAIIAGLLGSGARVAEWARLEVEDVAVTERAATVRLFGKGDQVRVVPLESPARKALSAYLLEHSGSGPLWIGRRGPMTTEGITQTVLAIGRAAGLPGLRPHRLRHTFATRLRQDGADVAQIQALLGHGSVETSARYFRASAAELQELVDRRWTTDHD